MEDNEFLANPVFELAVRIFVVAKDYPIFKDNHRIMLFTASDKPVCFDTNCSMEKLLWVLNTKNWIPLGMLKEFPYNDDPKMENYVFGNKAYITYKERVL